MVFHISGLTSAKAKEIEKLTDKPLTLAILKRKDVYLLLSKETKAYLDYNPKPVTYSYVTKYILPLVEDIAIITGSYRRKNRILNDVDIVLKPGKTIKKLWDLLKTKYDIIIYSSGTEKASAIAKTKSKAFKVDVWKTNKTNYIPMVLYSTGSAQHNIIMRMIAKRKKMTLNQHGLFKGKKRLRVTTENDIYNFLRMKYVEPDRRDP